jgi:hypothetical protein
MGREKQKATGYTLCRRHQARQNTSGFGFDDTGILGRKIHNKNWRDGEAASVETVASIRDCIYYCIYHLGLQNVIETGFLIWRLPVGSDELCNIAMSELSEHPIFLVC